MSKEKQIEELSDDIYTNCPVYLLTREEAKMIARFVIGEQGYSKQEWISVKERLPEEKQFVIVYDTVTECVRFLLYNSGADIWTGNIISHWMPLPEAPKMKGGE